MRSVQGVIESSYRYYSTITILIHRFPKALETVEKLVNEAASENFSASSILFNATLSDSIALSSRNEHDIPVLLYTEAAVAYA